MSGLGLRCARRNAAREASPWRRVLASFLALTVLGPSPEMLFPAPAEADDLIGLPVAGVQIMVIVIPAMEVPPASPTLVAEGPRGGVAVGAGDIAGAPGDDTITIGGPGGGPGAATDAPNPVESIDDHIRQDEARQAEAAPSTPPAQGATGPASGATPTPPTSAQAAGPCPPWTLIRTVETPYDDKHLARFDLGENTTFQNVSERIAAEEAERNGATQAEFDGLDRQFGPKAEAAYTDPKSRFRLVNKVVPRPGGPTLVTEYYGCPQAAGQLAQGSTVPAAGASASTPQPTPPPPGGPGPVTAASGGSSGPGSSTPIADPARSRLESGLKMALSSETPEQRRGIASAYGTPSATARTSNGQLIDKGSLLGAIAVRDQLVADLEGFKGALAQDLRTPTKLSNELLAASVPVNDSYVKAVQHKAKLNDQHRIAYYDYLRDAAALDAVGPGARNAYGETAQDLRNRAAQTPYQAYLDLQDQFFSKLEDNRLLGLRKDGKYLFEVLARTDLNSDQRARIVAEFLLDGIAQAQQAILDANAIRSVDELLKFGGPRHARQRQAAALAGGPLVAKFVSDLQTTYAVQLAAKEADDFVSENVNNALLGFVAAGSLLIPVIGPFVSAGVTAIQIVREGNELRIAYLNEKAGDRVAPVAGFVHRVSDHDRVEGATTRFLLTAIAAVPDLVVVAGGLKNIRIVKPGASAGAVEGVAGAARTANRTADTAASVERGVAAARELGLPEERINSLLSKIDPADPGKFSSLSSQKFFEGVSRIDDLRTAAIAAGADVQAVEAALQRARTARSVEGLNQLRNELGLLEADARGVTFFVDPSQREAFQKFVGGVVPRNVQFVDIVAAEDIRTALSFLQEGRTVRLTPEQVRSLRSLVARPDAARIYRFSPSEGGFLRIIDEGHLETARRLLQSPDLAAIVRGEAALARPGTSALRAVVSETADASGILNRIDQSALGAFPRAGVPGDAAFFKANGLEPVKTVKVGDQTFHLSKPFKGPDRIGIIAFQEGADGKVIPRTFYLSGEHGIFRVATGYLDDGPLRLIYKGPSKPLANGLPEFINKASADVAAELQGPLSRLVNEKGVVELPEEASRRAFFGHLESPNVSKSGVFGDPQEFARSVRRTDAEIPLPGGEGVKIDPEAVPIDRYTIENPADHYGGRLEGFVYRSKDGQTTYVILRDANGNVFVPSIQKSSSELTPFGTRSQAYNTDVNQTPFTKNDYGYIRNPAFKNSDSLAGKLPPPTGGAPPAPPAATPRAAPVAAVTPAGLPPVLTDPSTGRPLAPSAVPRLTRDQLQQLRLDAFKRLPEGELKRAVGRRIQEEAAAIRAERAARAQGAGPISLQDVVQPGSKADVSITSRGVSTGEAFELEVVNRGTKPIRIAPGTLVVEPVRGASRQRGTGFGLGDLVHLASARIGIGPALTFGRSALSAMATPSVMAAPSATVAATPAGALGHKVRVGAVGYCLEFLKQPPPAGTAFRIASPATQRRLAPLLRAVGSGAGVREAGLLRPDSDPDQYFHSARQWAIWTLEQKFTRETYERAFIAHTRKAAEAAGRKWTKPIEDAVRALVPNRWEDITRILREAESRA